MEGLTEQQKRDVKQIIRDELRDFLGFYKYNFQHDIDIFDKINIKLGSTVGTQFGTESTQKIGYLGATPVAQQTKITDCDPGIGGVSLTNAIDVEARDRIAKIIDVLEAFGYTSKT